MKTTAGVTNADAMAHEPPGHLAHVFVEAVPDLIQPGEYAGHPQGRLVRVRISVSADGVELLGDALRPQAVEAVLQALGGGPMEQMLCG